MGATATHCKQQLTTSRFNINLAEVNCETGNLKKNCSSMFSLGLFNYFLGSIWPHSFSTVCMNVIWLTLTHHILRWHPVCKQATTHTCCLISVWFTILQITFGRPYLLSTICADSLKTHNQLKRETPPTMKNLSVSPIATGWVRTSQVQPIAPDEQEWAKPVMPVSDYKIFLSVKMFSVSDFE